jgi:putative heme-binding domain-containing protein
VGSTRSRAALTAALRDPSATVALGYRAVTAVTRAGERVEGVVKGEDAFSIQVVTVDGELRAFRKRDLTEIARSTESLMPAYDVNRLSDGALEDLLAYLGTLRGAASLQ